MSSSGNGLPEDPALPPVAPFAEWIGLRTESAAGGRSLLRLEPRGELLNRRAVVHGGVLSTMLDSAMARASRTVEGVRELGGTIDLHVQFLRPATGELWARGWVDHAARTVAFCRGEVHDADGELVASGSASIRLRR